MFEFIDALISYSERYPGIKVDVRFKGGEIEYVHVSHDGTGLAVNVNTIEELSELDMVHIVEETIEDYKRDLEFIKQSIAEQDEYIGK